jgi:phosphoserine phosphatase RsbU/P
VQSNPRQAPGDVVRALNTALCRNIRERLSQDEHATLTILRYCRDGRLRFAGAHEDILVYRAATGRVELVPTPGTWVGIQPNIQVEETEILLADGDVLVLYTDGITEARNPARKLFGIERLVRLIEGLGSEPVQHMTERIIEAVLAWSPFPEDDVSVLVARHRAQ